jgi:hypothetical protein
MSETGFKKYLCISDEVGTAISKGLTYYGRKAILKSKYLLIYPKGIESNGVYYYSAYFVLDPEESSI